MMTRWSRRGRAATSLLATVLALALALVLTGCSEDEDPAPRPAPKPRPVTLTFGVFGTDAEVAAYRAMVDEFNAAAETIDVEVRAWPSSRAMVAEMEEAGRAPDVFLLARNELAGVVEQELNVPLFDLLEERDISYGDGYKHDALEGFSSDADLQCMPYDVSPVVLYYNTDLVDFTRMRERDLPVPSESLTSWSFEEFEAAVRFASRKRLGTKGLSLEPTLRSIAPFLYAGGGSLFDDDADPRALDLAGDVNQETLTRLLELARDPRVTLTDRQLRRATPLEWFKRGKLAIIEGSRALTPELREVDGLHFDVLPVPRLDRKATIGQMSGLCIGRGSRIQRAADFLVHAISAEGTGVVAEAGYIVPANLSVARSESFLQPEQQPAHAGVFNASVDSMVVLPLRVDYAALDRLVGRELARLLTDPVIDDLRESARAIDELSRPVVDPDYVPDEDPTADPTGGPTGAPSGSPGAGGGSAPAVSPSLSPSPTAGPSATGRPSTAPGRTPGPSPR